MTEERAATADPVEAHGPAEDPVATVVRGWQRHLADVGGPNTLLWYRDLPNGTIELSTAHPGGLAMLLAGRQTRLSDLVREPEALSRALARARAIREKAIELAEERGLTVCHLALGIATWDMAGGRRPAAPVLLRRCNLTPVDASHTDFTVDLADEVEVNPVLVEYLRSAHGIVLDPPALARRATVAGGFYPGPVYAALRQACRSVEGFDIAPRLVLSTFNRAKLRAVADLTAGRDVLVGHPVIAALAGDERARSELAGHSGDAGGTGDPGDAAPAGRRPAPDADPPALDADPHQQEAIDLALSGQSLVIDAPPGTGRARTVANLVAGFAAEGKRVLLVSQKQAALRQVRSLLQAQGLGDLVLEVDDTPGSGPRLLSELAEAATTTERVPAPDTATLDRIRDTARERLDEHVEALHTVRRPWGRSAHELQESIARLAGSPRPPRTRVRLTGDVLAAVDAERLEELGDRLTEVARAGAWDPDLDDDPWYRARVHDREEVERARETCERLVDGGLARVQQVFDDVFAELRFPAARTPAEYGEFLTAIEAVRSTLEVFTPEVYDAPLDSYVAATAPRSAPHRTPSFFERWRLRRQARRLLRPGTPPPDLHAALVEARHERSTWSSMAGAGGRPQIPDGIETAHEVYGELAEDLGWLGERLAATPEGGDLLGTEVARLRLRLERLAEHGERLTVVPDVIDTLDALSGAGLGPLVDDLAGRGVPVDAVREELTFLWWTSIVEHVAATDPRYAGPHGDGLRGVVGEFAAADRSRVASGAVTVRRAVLARCARVLDEHLGEVAALAAAEREGAGSLVELLPDAPHVLSALRPVWAMSPLLVAGEVPPGAWFDVVVVDHAGQAPTAEVVSALSRGHQVVAVGDDRQLGPEPFSTTVTSGEAPGEGTPAPSVLGDLGAFLPRRALRWDHGHDDERLVTWANDHVYGGSLRTLPGTSADAVVRLERVDGRGMLDSEDGVVETTDAEVDRVVELALEHARTSPQLSLGIVTLTAAQARAVDLALRAALADRPRLGAIFDGAADERTFVKPAAWCQGDERDVVIVSTGYGRTVHGRVIHRFGPVSGPGGDRLLTVALTRARTATVVVSALTAGDLDPERLKGRGPVLLREALAWAERGGSPDIAPGPEQRPTGVLEQDLARRLRQSGLVVHEGHGVGEDRIALAVEDREHPGRLLVAIESDGPAYARTRSVRERDRLRVDALRQRGWTHVRVWSTDLFRDPTREETRVLAAIHRAGLGREEPDE